MKDVVYTSFYELQQVLESVSSGHYEYNDRYAEYACAYCGGNQHWRDATEEAQDGSMHRPDCIRLVAQRLLEETVLIEPEEPIENESQHDS
jgi:hypothetical protein